MEEWFLPDQQPSLTNSISSWSCSSIIAVIIGGEQYRLERALSLSVLGAGVRLASSRHWRLLWTIFRLFIGEGLILGWLSWLLAIPSPSQRTAYGESPGLPLTWISFTNIHRPAP
jgi:hypothetical protein